jgi:hypothetical protein
MNTIEFHRGSLTFVAALFGALAACTPLRAEIMGPPEALAGLDPTGACCTAGNCAEVAESQCAAKGGTFLGGGSTCSTDSCLGACCPPNLEGCTVVTEQECNALEGSFQGVGTECNGFYCYGACCLPFGNCQELSPYDCSISEGVFLGGPCSKATCTAFTGACCFDNNACNDNLTQGNCLEFGGAYAGDNTTCATNPCAATGACCYPFGDGQFFCSDPSFEDQCINFGGNFSGIGSTCQGGACTPGPFGACCFFGNGGCQNNYTQQACAGAKGLYKGDNTVCTPAICCPADFNNDGAVNTPDLTYFLGRFGRSFPPPGSERADLIPDGVIDTRDLTRFLGSFGRQCPY